MVKEHPSLKNPSTPRSAASAASVADDLLRFSIQTSGFVIVPSCSHPGVKDRAQSLRSRLLEHLDDSSRRDDWQSG
jgi:hypothetical protein